MKHQVPYYSQFKDVSDLEWKPRSCTIVCLKMALDYLSLGKWQIPSIDHLIQEGVVIGGYSEHGWKHSSVAILAHNYGIPAYQEEFRSMSIDINGKKFIEGGFAEQMTNLGIKKIVSVLESNGLAIVSVPRGNQSGGSFHNILIVGFEKDNDGISGLYFHDPDSENEPQKYQFIAINDFILKWRKMAIFLGGLVE